MAEPGPPGGGLGLGEGDLLGQPRASARAATSSNSGVACRISVPGRPETLTRTGRPSTSTSRQVRSRMVRCHGADVRTPIVDVWVRRASATAPRSRPRASAVTVWAGRPFFMTMGVSQASTAPASSSRSSTAGQRRGSRSSTLAASSSTSWGV